MSYTDFRELKEFRDKIQDLGERGTKELCEQCSKELAGRLLTKVVKRTPVGVRPTGLSEEAQAHWQGYVGGTLRRGWTNGRKTTNIKAYAQGMRATRSGQNYSIKIINNVKYAPYVEYGHRQHPGQFVPALGKTLKASWVRGKFMMTISESEVSAIAQKVVDKKTKEYLERHLADD